jgi:hypothetical protein
MPLIDYRAGFPDRAANRAQFCANPTTVLAMAGHFAVVSEKSDSRGCHDFQRAN